jgi:hypothetical protein
LFLRNISQKNKILVFILRQINVHINVFMINGKELKKKQ